MKKIITSICLLLTTHCLLAQKPRTAEELKAAFENMRNSKGMITVNALGTTFTTPGILSGYGKQQKYALSTIEFAENKNDMRNIVFTFNILNNGKQEITSGTVTIKETVLFVKNGTVAITINGNLISGTFEIEATTKNDKGKNNLKTEKITGSFKNLKLVEQLKK